MFLITLQNELRAGAPTGFIGKALFAAMEASQLSFYQVEKPSEPHTWPFSQMGITRKRKSGDLLRFSLDAERLEDLSELGWLIGHGISLIFARFKNKSRRAILAGSLASNVSEQTLKDAVRLIKRPHIKKSWQFEMATIERPHLQTFIADGSHVKHRYHAYLIAIAPGIVVVGKSIAHRSPDITMCTMLPTTNKAVCGAINRCYEWMSQKDAVATGQKL